MNTHEKFKEYGRKSLEYRRKCELLLPEIYKKQIWREHGFGNIYEYAAKLAGMSNSVVDNCLRIYQKIHDKPELLEIAEKKGLNAVKPVAYIANIDTAAFWAEKAKDMSNGSLSTYVKEYRRSFGIENIEADGDISGLDKNVQMLEEVVMTLKPQILRQLEKMRGESTWNDLMEKLVINGIAQMPKAVKATSRHVPNPLQRFVKGKFNELCHFPGCKLRGEIFHHTQRFALEKVHDPARLVYLCTEHERIVHLGLVDFEDKSPHEWRLRTNADTNDYKYFVDQQVKIHRKNSVLAGG